MLYRHGLGGLFAVILGLLSHNAARADLIFVANAGNGTIGEYTTAGATVNPALISGLFAPYAIAVVVTVPEPGSGILTHSSDSSLQHLPSGRSKKSGIAVAGGQ